MPELRSNRLGAPIGGTVPSLLRLDAPLVSLAAEQQFPSAGGLTQNPHPALSRNKAGEGHRGNCDTRRLTHEAAVRTGEEFRSRDIAQTARVP
jgi:hypothetical protein